MRMLKFLMICLFVSKFLYPNQDLFSSFLRGSYYYSQRDYKNAIIEYNRVAKSSQSIHLARLRIGQSLIHLKKNDEALKSLIPLSQGQSYYSGEADVLIASIYLQRNEKMTALSFLNHALYKDHHSSKIYHALSSLYSRMGFLNEAISTNQKAILLFPYDIDFRIVLGDLLIKKERYKDALKVYEEAYKKDKKQMKILIGMAFCLEKTGRYDDAIHYMKKSLEISPLNKKIYIEIIRLLSNSKQWKAAFEYSHELLLIDDLDVDSVLIYLKLCHASQQYEKGVEYFEKYQSNYIQNDQILLWGAKLYQALSHFELAKDYYFKSLSVKKTSDAYYQLALLKLELKEEEKSIEFLKQCLEVDSQHAKAMNMLGYIFLEQNRNLDDALILIEKALKLDPENPSFLDSMAWVLFKKGNYKEALLYQKEAYKRSKERVIIQHLIQIYQKLGDSEAVQQLTKELDSLS